MDDIPKGRFDIQILDFAEQLGWEIHLDEYTAYMSKDDEYITGMGKSKSETFTNLMINYTAHILNKDEG